MRRFLIPGLLLALAGFGCGSDSAGQPTPPDMMQSEDFPLTDAESLLDGVPANEDLPEEGKADQTLPGAFDLIDTMSPVKSQGSRGVCSIFGTTALMEHLYITEGTIPNPDFSEQFLQWSSKFEGRYFRSSGGSNARSNIDTLARYGSVFESEWPYESQPWGTSNDPECTGEDRPTRCYTNGEPPATALEAQRFTIGRGRYIRASARSIKSHMFNTNTAVQIGGDFFYQAWNHGRTTLERSPEFRAYRNHGYILPPTAADRMDSSGDRRAGHSYLAVGWDDNLEVQAIDDDGNLRVDENGDPVMVKGFFLFKNSWGTGWASDNEHGPGYGWIAYEYVERYLSAYASSVPEVEVNEVCGDGRDNDFNGDTDCADAACASDRSCVDPLGEYTNTTAESIPDNDASGIESTIEVAEGGTITGVSVDVNITHTYRGDLTVQLVKGDTTVTLHEREGAGEDDLQRTFDVSEFDGEDSAGTWTLRVVDNARADTGQLNSWGLRITRCAGDECSSMPTVDSFSNDTLVVIPDGGDSVSSTVTADGGDIAALRVTVDITHPFIADLDIALVRNGTRIQLLREEYIDGTSLNRTFDVADFNGEDSAGEWELRVADIAAGDEGTLNSWSIEITR